MDISTILDGIAGILVMLTVIGLGVASFYFAYKEEKRKKKACKADPPV